jgi:3-(3-hydroxy-phenyl)propionate hydroxylase
MIPGAPAADAPVLGPRGNWLLDYLDGGFNLLVFGNTVDPALQRMLAQAAIPCAILKVATSAQHGVVVDTDGLVASRYDGSFGTCYLFRPDQYVCARWRELDNDAVLAAIARATCNERLPS